MKISPNVDIVGRPPEKQIKEWGRKDFAFSILPIFLSFFSALIDIAQATVRLIFLKKKRSFCGSEGKMGVI